MPTQSVDPRTGQSFGPAITDSSAEDVDSVVRAASEAGLVWGDLAPASRASALRAVADALDARADDLVALADRESGLGQARLAGELALSLIHI